MIGMIVIEIYSSKKLTEELSRRKHHEKEDSRQSIDTAQTNAMLLIEQSIP